MQIGKNIKAARKARGWTQLKLSRKSGVAREVIAHYETDRGDVSLGKLVLLSRALRVPVLRLLKL